MKNKILALIKTIEETINSTDISKLSQSPENIKPATSSVNSSITSAKDRFNFKTQTSTFYQQYLDAQIEQLKEMLYSLGADYKKNKPKYETEFNEIFNIAKELSSKEKFLSKDAQNPKIHKDNLNTQFDNLKTQLDKLKTIVAVINISSLSSSVPSSFKINIPSSIPADIKSEVSLDVKELENAFNAGCYRASIILCGRILETCLHRKYFEATGNDLLETSPGIGLGNLIAKISEKGITLDPGLTHQIHLINNVRIFSVHKKKELFIPSKQQTYAMILYTMDVVGRLF